MNVDFPTAIKLFFANYVNFKGRSTRAEFWWVILFNSIVSSLLSFFGFEMVGVLYYLAVFIPTLAITFRRFHDAGRSGWWVIFLYVASCLCAGAIFGPLALSAMEYSHDPIGLQRAVLDYMTINISTLRIGGIIALALAIFQIFILVKPSEPDNKYGPNPYGSYNG